MKKLICMILALIMVLSLCACGTNDNGQTGGSVNETGTNQNVSTDNAGADADANVEAIKAALTGTWVPITNNKYEDGSNIITFHEDGTIDMLGTTYTWEVTHAPSEEEGYLALYDGETKFYTAEYEFKDKVLNYLCFERVKGADDKYRLSDEYSMYATGYYKEADYQVIEITADNYSDYFEMKEFASVTKDSFGDATKIRIYHGLVFKEEYGKVNLSISQCAFEYAYHTHSQYEVTVDKTTGEYTYCEKVKDGNPNTVIKDCQKQGNLEDGYGIICASAIISSFPSDKIYLDDEIEVTRASGKIFVYTPAE